MNRPVKLAIAVVTIAALLGIYTFVQNSPNTEDQAFGSWELRENIRLTDFDQDVQIIRLISMEQTITIIRSEDQGWRVDYPFDVQWIANRVSRPGNAFPRLAAERRIQEPEALSVYGLDDPVRIVEAVFEDGRVERILIGNEIPSGMGYYAMLEGAEDVYIVRKFDGDIFLMTYDDLRDKNLPGINFQDIRYLELNLPPPGERIVVERVGEDDHRFPLIFSMYQITSPFEHEYSVDEEGFQKILESLTSMTNERFVEDRPSDYAQYGIGPHAPRILLRDSRYELEIVFGNRVSDTAYFAQIEGRPEVFVLQTDLSLLQTDPFEFVSRFALILRISEVDLFIVETPNERFVARIQRDGENRETFFLNDAMIENSSFRGFYQTVVGLRGDARNRNPVAGPSIVTITYHLTHFPEPLRLELVPHTRGFFAAFQDGRSDFLVSEVQVDRLITTARSLLQGKGDSE